MSQAYACTCNCLMRMIFYSQLHAIFGMFYLHFSVNVYASGTVLFPNQQLCVYTIGVDLPIRR